LISNEELNKTAIFHNWLESRKLSTHFNVAKIPLNKLDQWHFSAGMENIYHSSGKFFRIEGIKVKTNFGKKSQWEQPIINQPEIGILGLISKVFNGIRYFLIQAKIEPGNINGIQISPTLQATKSNFTQVHKGKLPPYLEYFIIKNKSIVLLDQLQAEQGGRFLKKRNRNIVIEVREEIEIFDDFYWLSLGEIKKLLSIDNMVNMDARSVLSIIPIIDDEIVNKFNINKKLLNDFTNEHNLSLQGFNKDIVQSCCSISKPYKTINELISWYTDQKTKYFIEVEKTPLSKLDGWKITPNAILNSEQYFSVIGVKVEAGTREVTQWSQPLIEDENIGLLGFILKKINGVIHFLVQAKVEPGNIDIIDLSPSVSCSNLDFIIRSKDQPTFLKYFSDLNLNQIVHYNTLQSEEGGRFYKVQNRNMIVEIPENEELDIPDNFIWMTLNQMMDFMKFSMFNIEARSLIASLSFID
jgi:oxidase EvaA